MTKIRVERDGELIVLLGSLPMPLNALLKRVFEKDEGYQHDPTKNVYKLSYCVLPTLIKLGQKYKIHFDLTALPREWIVSAKKALEIPTIEDTYKKLFAVLYLTPQAPVEVIKAAYRALSMSYHPDKGGDIKQMQRLNVAYQAISKIKGIT